MARIDELTDLKAIAIVLLFFVHSNLQITMPAITLDWITPWFLSALFFVSGYLTFSGFFSRKQSIREFLGHRFWSVYLPFVLIMGFYVLADNIVHYGIAGFFSHASLLSLFAYFSEGKFAMYQFWFIPQLIGFTILLVFLQKYVKNDLAQYSALIGLFIFNVFSYAYNTPWSFEWNFGFYLFVFAVGFTVCKRNWLQRLRSAKILSILVLILIASYFISLPTLDLNTELGRAQYFSYTWIRSTAFSLSSVMVLLTLLFYLRRTFRSRRMYAIPEFLGSYTLYIYLWEGYVSPRICGLVFGVSFYYQLSGALLFASILVRIATVSVVAYLSQLLHQGIGHSFRGSHQSMARIYHKLYVRFGISKGCHTDSDQRGFFWDQRA